MQYIMLGGLMSAIFTEIVQFFLIWFGLFLVAILGTIEMGGMQAVLTGLPETMSKLWATTGTASSGSGAGATASRPTRRRRSARSATTRCRSCGTTA